MTTDSPSPTPQPPTEASASRPPQRGGIGRIVKWVVLGIVALVVVGIAIVWMNLNSIVRKTVETQASSSLDLKTTLGSANVSIFGGSVSLKNLDIGSPPDFKAPQMLSLGEAGVKVSLGELREDPVHVQRVTIDKPKVVIEANGTKLNFQALMERPSKTPPTVEPPSGSTEPGKPAEPMKLIIDELTVSGAQVALRPGLSGIKGIKDEYTLTIPDIQLNSIGRGEGAQNGAAIKDVVGKLLNAIAAKAAESDQLPPELKQLLNLNVNAVAEQLGQEANKQLDRAKKELEKKVGGDVGKKLDGALKDRDVGRDVEKGLKDILGGDKKNDQKPTTRPK